MSKILDIVWHWQCRCETHDGRDLLFVRKLNHGRILRKCRQCGVLVICLKCLMLFVGCSAPVAVPQPQPATLPPELPKLVSSAVVAPPRVILIGTNNGCPVYSNTVLHFTTTNCPAKTATNIVLKLVWGLLPQSMVKTNLMYSSDLRTWRVMAVISNQIAFTNPPGMYYTMR